MEIVALDGSKLLALMVAGGTFALAGLWLMFRPQPAGEAARIEIFGLKFQASSAGLLVFLIGAGFLVIPVVVPEKPESARGELPTAGRTQPIVDPALGRDGTNKAPGISFSRPDRIAVHGEEAEPNNSFAQANVVPLGSAVTGYVEKGDPDFFVFEVADGTEGEVVFNATAQYIEMTVYDDAGAVLWTDTVAEYATFTQPAEHARYAVRLGHYLGADSQQYHLTVALRPR